MAAARAAKDQRIGRLCAVSRGRRTAQAKAKEQHTSKDQVRSWFSAASTIQQTMADSRSRALRRPKSQRRRFFRRRWLVSFY